jgi:predicted protein tyrosine phosphatase
MRILFLCSQNKLRIPTAEVIFSTYKGLEVTSAGTAPGAAAPVSADLVEWADTIFVMENHHREKLRRAYGKLLATKRLIVLRIRDEYTLMQPELVDILKSKVLPHLHKME